MKPLLLLASLMIGSLWTVPAAALLRAQPEPGFPEAVFVEPIPDGQSFGDCSGVILSPTIVLTAAHCLSGQDFAAPATLAARISVYDAPDHVVRQIEATAYVRSPSYLFALSPRTGSCNCQVTATAANDWGLLEFDQPLGIAVPRRIDDLLPEALRARLARTSLHMIGSPAFVDTSDLWRDLQAWLRDTFFPNGSAEAIVVGFGYGACPNEASGLGCSGKGVRRSASVRVGADPRCGRSLSFTASDVPIEVLCVTALHGGHVPITFADSGAPIYLRAPDGGWVLAGTVSTNTATGFSGSDAHAGTSILFILDALQTQLGNATGLARPTVPLSVH